MFLGLGFLAMLTATYVRSAPDNLLVAEFSDSASTQRALPQALSDPPKLPKGEVLGEQDATSPGTLKSENFRLESVSVGGDTVLSEDNSDLGKLEVSFVRGEAFLEKNKKTVKALITWKTSKAAQSTLTYGKNNGGFTKSLSEDGYGLDHSMIISDLEQASTYVYSITVRDRAGNEVITDSYAVYTGTKSASLFDLISGAVQDVFGWAIKK